MDREGETAPAYLEMDSMGSEYGIDDIDRKIIDILMKDARTPYLEIARILKISEATVRKRVRSLESRGIIKGYTIKVDEKKLGYKVVALVGVDADPATFINVAREIAEMEEARMVAVSSGDHMIMAEIWAKDPDHFSSIIERISRMNGVKRICPAVILERIK